AKIDPLAPIARMIITVADERTLRANAEPEVPVESGWNRIAARGHGFAVAPLLVAEGVDLFDFTDGPGLDELNSLAIDIAGMNLNSHLRHEFFLAREFREPPRFINIVR